MNILLAKLCQCFTHVMRRLSCVSVEDSCIDAPCSHTRRPNPLSYGIYQCECPVGYKREDGDNHNCQDIDECEEESDVCDQECRDTDGSYQCWCRPGKKKSIRLNARTLMSVPTAVMTVNRFVWTPSALSCVLVTILTDLDQTASTAWII